MTRTTPWSEAALDVMLRWKATTGYLPDAARVNGHAFVEEHGRLKKTRPSRKMLPVEFADHSLLPAIREEALSRFEHHEITWHLETPMPSGKLWPSTHLLDSQVQCVNVLLSLAQEPELLLDLVRLVVPDAASLVAVEDDSLVAFVWIGLDNYLGEGRGRPRKRGKYATSADALVVANRGDGGRTGVLIEWKFTEFYDKPVNPVSRRGTDRRNIYRPMYHAAPSPFAIRPPIGAFFHEPHYQLLRQALLGASMVEAREFDIDRLVHLHLVPSLNTDILRLVPGGLQTFGSTIDEVWTTLLPGPAVTYRCLDTLPLLGLLPEVAERYGPLAQARI